MNARTIGKKNWGDAGSMWQHKSTGPRTTSAALTLKSDLDNVKQVN